MLQPTKVIQREPPSRPQDQTWSGPGFMQVYEGSDLTFDIPAIFRDLDYDLVVRHETIPNHPNTWQDARAELIRIDGPPDPNGKCANTNDGPIQFSMANNERHTVLASPFCLEEGQRYQVKLSFPQYDQAAPDPKASVLIDSVSRVLYSCKDRATLLTLQRPN